MSSTKMKKDFDKENMFRRIMPSMGAPQQPPAMPEETVQMPPAHPVRAREQAVPMQPEQPPEQEVEIAIPAAEPQEEEAPAGGADIYNVMQEILLEKLPHTLKILRACECLRCQMDVMAIALNELPPAYAVVDEEHKEKKFQAIQNEYDVKATAALIRAVQTVKTVPRHNQQAPAAPQPEEKIPAQAAAGEQGNA